MTNLVSFPQVITAPGQPFDQMRHRAAPVVRMRRNLHFLKLATPFPCPIFINGVNGPILCFGIPQMHPWHREILTAIYPDDRGDHGDYVPKWLDDRDWYELLPADRFLRMIQEDIKEIVVDRILSRGGMFIEVLTALLYIEENKLQVNDEWWITKAIYEASRERKRIRSGWKKRASGHCPNG